MSRSYKKNPIIKDGSKGRRSGRSMKAIANRKVRRTEDLPIRARGAYKKVFEQWDISDWMFEFTYDQAKQQWYEEEATYPRYENRYAKDENGEWVRTQVLIEKGWLHSKYRTLDEYLIDIKKDYYLK